MKVLLLLLLLLLFIVLGYYRNFIFYEWLIILFFFTGPFEKIPLALVLSSEAECREFPRHLRLAKLLVEGGANPNIRIPHAEWQGASPSPMEYVWTLYDLANDLCRFGSDSLLVINMCLFHLSDASR
jgi:hypothetical protein